MFLQAASVLLAYGPQEMMISGAGVAAAALPLIGYLIYQAGQRKKLVAILKERGMSTKAWIVQANDDLYKAGGRDLPAKVIVSFPDENGVGDEVLAQLAAKMFALRDGPCVSKAEVDVKNMVLDDDFVGEKQGLLPRGFTGGKDVFWVDLRVKRRSLPNRVLNRRYLQFLALRSDKRVIFEMVPYVDDSTAG